MTDELIRQFAELSGDFNAIHLDEEFAKTTRFGKRIAHGMLSGAFISAVLGYEFSERKILYLSQTMKEIEKDPEELISSRVRYFRANRLLRDNSTHTIKTLQAIQKDHVNLPNSICNHNIQGIDPMDRENTITALVIDLTAREMHIAWGNPCQNTYHTYHLNA